jgi:uncharacterized protein (DUF58 family)
MAKVEQSSRVYADLSELCRLRYSTGGFSLLPRQPIHSLLAGQHASKLRGRGLDFDEIRKYQPGDDIRQIDWKVTARTRETHCRVYTEERERSVLLLVDQRLSMFFGSVYNMKSVIAAEAAALAAWKVLSQKDRIGAFVFNDSCVAVIPPRRSESNAMQIFNAVIQQNHALNLDAPIARSPAMFNEVLRRCGQIAKHDCLVIIISDGNGSDEQSQHLISRIGQHNDVLVCFVYDPLEMALPRAGRLDFGDGVSKLEIDTSNTKLNNLFQSTFAERRQSARRYLLHREVPVLSLSTESDVAGQVLQQLGRRLP